MRKVFNLIFILLILSNIFYVNNVSAEEVFYLYDVIKNQAVMDNLKSEFVTGENGIDFSNVASDTNGKGVYTLSSSKDDNYPIHYYRGDVENNNVIFADLCWKIVRTTDKGGIKLIYNGKAENGVCSDSNDAIVDTTKYNESNLSLSDVGYMYGKRYPYSSRAMNDSQNYIYGNDVEWNNDSKQYVLKDTYVSKNGWVNDYKEIGTKYHYTCFSISDTCDTMYYIHNLNGTIAFYITLEDGKNINDAIDDMTQNINDSLVKEKVDNFYKENLLNYESYIEDTVWCNDRSPYKKNGWDKDFDFASGGHEYLFGSYGRAYNTFNPITTCPNKNDAFTVNEENGNGDLKYPIGLITEDEFKLAGGTNAGNITLYLKTTGDWWTMSPGYFGYSYARRYIVWDMGSSDSYDVNQERGVRPMIALKGDTKITGTGVLNDPYVVQEGYKVSFDTEGTSFENVTLNDRFFTAGTSIKIDNIKIGTVSGEYKFMGWTSNDVEVDTDQIFTMPEHDVVLTPILEKIEVNNPNTFDYIVPLIIVSFGILGLLIVLILNKKVFVGE